MNTQKILIVTGPTASGKSARALAIAQENDGVIINADSQQIYAELRVLTARPTEEEEALAPHRLYGFMPAARACSVGEWLTQAKMEIDWALAQGKLPIVTGGTGMYLKALIEGIADIPDVLPEVRAQAESDLAVMGHEAFHARLQVVDQQAAEKIPAGNSQRMVRAYAVWLGTGKNLTHWQSCGNKSFYDKSLFEILKVEVERDVLYARAEKRFDQMMKQGALEEVEALLALQLSDALPAMRIIGVPELGSYLRGESTLEEAVSKAKQATRNYIKRQITWFRHQLPDGKSIA